MASEAVNAVLTAEKENDMKIAEANSASQRIISEAEEKSTVLIGKYIADAKSKAQKIKAEADAKAEETVSSAGTESDSAILADVDKKLYAAAVDAVKAKALG